jgi:hypothetical protein
MRPHLNDTEWGNFHVSNPASLANHSGRGVPRHHRLSRGSEFENQANSKEITRRSPQCWPLRHQRQFGSWWLSFDPIYITPSSDSRRWGKNTSNRF